MKRLRKNWRFLVFGVLTLALAASIVVQAGPADKPDEKVPNKGSTYVTLDGQKCLLTFRHKCARDNIGISRKNGTLEYEGADYPNVFVALYEDGTVGVAEQLQAKLASSNKKVIETEYLTLTLPKGGPIKADTQDELEAAIERILDQDGQEMRWELIAAEWSGKLWERMKRKRRKK